ncbi:uncharacterized protein BDV17DRAFT_288937 [Aspergillus undulatus]|uniref:uncharacterized protein n=1 Tax=Aspergillus undulatus TaxID=1810928 RepID=UPI003CCD34BF
MVNAPTATITNIMGNEYGTVLIELLTPGSTSARYIHVLYSLRTDQIRWWKNTQGRVTGRRKEVPRVPGRSRVYAAIWSRSSKPNESASHRLGAYQIGKGQGIRIYPPGSGKSLTYDCTHWIQDRGPYSQYQTGVVNVRPKAIQAADDEEFVLGPSWPGDGTTLPGIDIVRGSTRCLITTIE